MDDDQAGNGERGSKEESGREEHRGGDESFLTLRDQVRQATPVHPPADPAADQRRRTASLQRLLSLFTGQDYGDPEDPAGEQAAETAEISEERGGNEMLGGWRDADSPAPSTSPDIPGLAHGQANQAVSSKDSHASNAPMPWDQPMAANGGEFSMPDELPSALPSGSTSLSEPWLADDANNTSSLGSQPSPAYEGLAKPRGEGDDSVASGLETFNSPTPLNGMGGPIASNASEGNATTGSDSPAAGQAPAPSALSDDTLATQLAAPVAALPTALPAGQPGSAVTETATPPMESTEADGEASFEDGNPTSKSDKGAEAAPPGTTDSDDPGELGADSASINQGSSSGGVLSLEIPDLPDVLAAAVQAGTAGFQSAAREIMATLSESVETSIAQLKDLNSRFDQHQMDELMKASQMRAIYRR